MDKKKIYVALIAILTMLASIASIICWIISQTRLQEIALTTPEAVVQAGTAPFLFAIITFILTTATTCCYITTWRMKPCGNETYTKEELILLSCVALIAIITNFGILNLSWQYSFIGVSIIIYEILTFAPLILRINRNRT